VVSGFPHYEALLLWEAGEISEGQAVLLLGVEDRIAARDYRNERLDNAKAWLAKNVNWDDLKTRHAEALQQQRELEERLQKRKREKGV
jgi:hypothetical protein